MLPWKTVITLIVLGFQHYAECGDVTASVVDVPHFVDISTCPKCSIDQHYEKGTHGGYISCKCVRSVDGLVQSDMRVDEANRDLVNYIFGRASSSNSADLTNLYWPREKDGHVQIPYIIGPSFQGKNERLFQQALSLLESKTCIRFVDRTTEDDFIEIIEGDGCWSFLGKRYGRQQLSLGTGCNRLGIILHELLHALGFFHEHSRPDREEYVSVEFKNVIPGEEGNFDKIAVSEVFGGQPYDYNSVMHFGERAYSKNNETTLQVQNGEGHRVQIGQRDQLSTMDIRKINQVYCPKSKPFQKENGARKMRSSESTGQCGKPKIKPNMNQRIVGGVMVDPGAIPWQISIRFGRNNAAICGGSLIDQTWILTAAHCVKTKLTKYYKVYLGIHEKYPSKSKVEHAILINVIKVIVHDDYNSETMENDIALLQLGEPVQYTDYILPICLPPTTHQMPEGQKVTVSGWGDTSELRTRATHLMKVDLQLVNSETCAVWLSPHAIRDSMICAGYESGNKDACQGDSGGPLTQNVDGTDYLVGVVSWGLGCARKEKPGVYSKVSFYRDWIQGYAGI